jgi:hypothetical protein
MPTERRYSEKEMRAIFERAARHPSSVARTGEAGLSLAELQEIGAAAGLDPAAVAAAAGELHAPAAPRRRVLGLTRELTHTRLLPGPVSDDAWGQIVADLRRHAGADGLLSQVGRIRSWTSSTSDGDIPLRASLEPEGEGVRLTLMQRPGDLVALLTAMPLGIAVLIGVLAFAVNGSTAALLVLPVAAALYLVVRAAYERSVSRTARRFEAILDRAEARPRAPEPLQTTAPLLDLDAAPDPTSEHSPASATRTRA